MQLNEKKENKKLALVLFGSPKPKGYTSQLLQAFLKEIEGEYSFVIIDAYQYNVHSCTGCGYCEAVDDCQYSDFEEIHQLLCKADLLIVATPSYNLTFPSPLKAIFDRMQRYFSARFVRGIKPPIAKHKRAVLMMTCGSDSNESADVMRSQLKRIFTVINATLEQEVVWKDTDHEHSIDKIQAVLQAAAKEILK